GAVRRIACLFLEPGGHEHDCASAGDLLAAALAYSPRVEEAGPGVVYLDVAGLERLFGSELEIARGLVRGATARRPRVQVGMAGSRLGALVAARRGRDVAIVEAGAESEYLASASLSLLGLPEEMAARLHRWGIRTMGELAALPTAALFERLGSEGVRLQRLATGGDLRPLRSLAPPPSFQPSVEP